MVFGEVENLDGTNEEEQRRFFTHKLRLHHLSKLFDCCSKIIDYEHESWATQPNTLDKFAATVGSNLFFSYSTIRNIYSKINLIETPTAYTKIFER